MQLTIQSSRLIFSLLFVSFLTTTGCAGETSNVSDTNAGSGGAGGSGGSGSGVSSATLTWKSPTRNADDSYLDDLAGYKISYGQSSGSYSNITDLQLGDPKISCQDTAELDSLYGVYVQSCVFTIDNLSQGTWYFTVQAYDLDGNESGYSSQGNKSI